VATRWSHTSRISTCLLFGAITTKRASCASHLRFSPACSNPRCLLPLVALTLPADPPLWRSLRKNRGFLIYEQNLPTNLVSELPSKSFVDDWKFAEILGGRWVLSSIKKFCHYCPMGCFSPAAPVQQYSGMLILATQ
jgi:hypothetical protein